MKDPMPLVFVGLFLAACAAIGSIAARARGGTENSAGSFVGYASEPMQVVKCLSFDATWMKDHRAVVTTGEGVHEVTFTVSNAFMFCRDALTVRQVRMTGGLYLCSDAGQCRPMEPRR